MGKKRLVIDLDEADHAELVRDARFMGLTASNYVRNALGIPPQRQGVKAVVAVKAAKKKPAAKEK